MEQHEHIICVREASISRLDERTNNFNRRFDEVSKKIDEIKVQITDLRESFLVEKSENKWKHRISKIVYGMVGGGSIAGILKVLTTIFMGK